MAAVQLGEPGLDGDAEVRKNFWQIVRQESAQGAYEANSFGSSTVEPVEAMHLIIIPSTLVSASTIGVMDCAVLSVALPGLVYMPGTEEYIDSTGTYFAAFENELKPLCVLQPRSAHEVAKAIKYLSTTPTNVHIAIRGGGHTPWAGAANIEKGISLDLRKLKGIALNADKTMA